MRVADSYVAPALELIGTRDWVEIPLNHRDNQLSPELLDAILVSMIQCTL